MFRCLLLAASCLAVLASLPVHAAETQPGDSCAGQTDLIRTVGGPENPGTGYLLVCDGTVWKAVKTWDSASGRSLFQVNTDAGGCTSTKLGRLRYDGSSTWEYCNGSTWTALPGSVTPAGSDKQIQLNSNGVLYASTGLNFGSSTGYLGVGMASPLQELDILTSTAWADLDIAAQGLSGGARQANINLYSERGTLSSDISENGSVNKGWTFRAVGGGGAGGQQDDFQIISRVPSNSAAHIIVMNIDGQTGKIGIGGSSGAVNAVAPLDVQSAITAASAVAYGVRFKQTLTAAVNNDALNALYIDPTFADASKTGVAHNGLIVASGNVGIDTTTPAKTLDVVGDIQFTGTLADVSDRRLKSDIAPLPPQLAKIGALAPVSFTMKADPERRTELGLIAQDVEAIYPDLVSTNPNGTKAMNYQGLIAPMIAAMQEQQREIETLRAENAALSRRLDAIEEAAAFAPAPVPRRLPPPLYNQ